MPRKFHPRADPAALTRSAPKHNTKLRIISIRHPCTVPWDSMRGDERIRHCALCDKDVFNVSKMTPRETEALFGEDICIRVIARADGTVVQKQCGESKRKRAGEMTAAAATAAVLFTVSAAAGSQLKHKSLRKKWEDSTQSEPSAYSAEELEHITMGVGSIGGVVEVVERKNLSEDNFFPKD